MTADHDNTLAPEGGADASNHATATESVKKSPRRKVAARPKAPTVVESAGEAAGNLPLVGETPQGAPRSRRKKVVGEPAEVVEVSKAPDTSPRATPAAPVPVAVLQARIFSPAELSESSVPQAQVETRVIPRTLMREIEKRTEQNFPRPQPVVAAAPPAFAPEAANTPSARVESPVEQSPAREERPAALEYPVPSADGNDGGTTPPRDAQPTDSIQPAPVPDGRGNNNIRDDRRPDGNGGGGQPFQNRRGDHRQQGRNDYQQRGGGTDHHPQQGRGGEQPSHGRGDHQQQGRGDYQQGRGGGQQGRGGNQPGFRQQGGGRQEYQGNDGGGQGRPRQPFEQTPSPQPAGGVENTVSRVTEPQFSEGIIEVSGKGFGFLREAKRNFVQTPADVFVTPEVCRDFNLRDGQWIKGEVRRSGRGPQLFRLTEINGDDPKKFLHLPNFEELTSINPKKRIKLETVGDRYTTRVMDLMTPIGKGQRGIIVAPPRTGKTTLLQHIAEAVVKNHPEIKLIILLVDERPEEVTEIRRSVPEAEIMASSNDSDLKSHTRIAQLAIERAKRLVEAGRDVFILLDSITRMARAFNNSMSGGGRGTASGGLAVGALEIPRKIFAAARNTEEAGSLTIMATALIETNSKMDDAIFQEFKGTGNMELVLDRKISDQRIYPAVDIFLSGTRREELLLQSWELDKINVIRRGLAGHKPIEAIERLLTFLKKFPTNTQMLASLPG